MAQVVCVQLQGGLHLSAQKTLTHIENIFAANDDDVIALLDVLYLDVIADHARRPRFLQAITILQNRIRSISAKDRGYAHIAIAQAQGGTLVAVRCKVAHIHDPAIKASSYRQLAVVWAKDQDAQKVRKWID